MSGATIATVVGARPEFVQVGAITREVRRRAQRAQHSAINNHLIHTGQHYDHEMSMRFFEELDLPAPHGHLEVGSISPAAQVGEITLRLDPVLAELAPDYVLVLGDTNSTLAGALAAAKLGLPVAHVESGLRSFNLNMPEELNRRITDQVAKLLFCPSENAVSNLRSEGITDGVHLTGDVMYETLKYTMDGPGAGVDIGERFGVEPGAYIVATTHRAENTDDGKRLHQILLALTDLARGNLPVIFPIHPRTRARLQSSVMGYGVEFIDPIPHSEMAALVASAALLMTDSGGLQKEAYWLSTPCVTVRDETEWVETVANGWNVLAGAERGRIVSEALRMLEAKPDDRPPLYGEGSSAAKAIVDLLCGVGLVEDAAAS